MENEEINFDSIRCVTVKKNTYINKNDLVMALCYETDCLYNDFKNCEGFNKENAKLINDITDWICKAIDRIP